MICTHALCAILPMIATPIGSVPGEPIPQTAIQKNPMNPSPWHDAICHVETINREKMIYCFTPTLQLNGIAEGYFPHPDQSIK